MQNSFAPVAIRVSAWLLLLVVTTSASAANVTPTQRLQQLYDEEYSWRQQQQGKVLDEQGEWQDGPHLPQVDAATHASQLVYWRRALQELDSIDVAKLEREEQVNAAVFRQIVETRINDERYKTYEAPFNSDTFFWSDLYPRMGGFKTKAEYSDYLDRLAELPRYFQQHIANMQAGLARGYSLPQVTLAGRDRSIEPYLDGGKDNPYWIPLRDMPPGITGADREALESQALAVIESAVLPAYRELLKFIRQEYQPQARQSLAARELPDGEAFYRDQIRAYTTLDLTPEEIHQRGLAEVARIRKDMEATKTQAGFDGDMAAFFEFLRTDPQFYARTPHELLAFSAYVAKRVDGKLADTLGFLPRRRFTILPVPDAIAPIYTSGRGGLDSCLMNTYDLPSRPLYSLTALTLHECGPGHALQAAIAKEAPGSIPRFRADNYFSGYGEGWGLYTEWLGTLMGVYDTPYEEFGRLSYEMWRACRLVIDTGVHYYGWSRERAQTYLSENTALSELEVTTEIDRYISWPGQALAYKLGEMLIRSKRQQAEEALGAEFDQRYFHDAILKLRSVPLPVLADELDAWIAGGGRDPYAPEPVVPQPDAAVAGN